jgi:hypothetical protein
MKATSRVLLMGLLFFGSAELQGQETDWGGVGGGYIYQFTDGANGHWANTQGWYVLPTFQVTKHVSAFADFANFYGTRQNVHIELFGAAHGFGNKTRYTPFIFIGPGFIRDSYAGDIAHSFAWCTGAGLTVRLTRLVSFQTIPVEYVDNTASGNTGRNLALRAGFVLAIPKKHTQ